jgi:hypothetical protein
MTCAVLWSYVLFVFLVIFPRVMGFVLAEKPNFWVFDRLNAAAQRHWALVLRLLCIHRAPTRESIAAQNKNPGPFISSCSARSISAGEKTAVT